MNTPAFGGTEQRLRPRYARIGLLGLGLITTTLAIFAVLVLVQFPDEAFFILPMFAFAAIATALVWRFDATWALAVGIAVPLVVGFMMFWAAFGLAHPTSFLDFVPAVTFVLGIALALFGNIAAMIQRRRRHLEAHVGATELHIEQVALAVVALAVVYSGVLNLLNNPTVDEADAIDAVSVEMTDFAFEPASVAVVGGGQLLVHNGDPLMHDIAVPELGIDPLKVPPGGDVLVDIPSTSGTYTVYCTLHSDPTDPSPDPEEGMVATMQVQ